jgi:hypothetical protein
MYICICCLYSSLFSRAVSQLSVVLGLTLTMLSQL